jgi:hypothetical protein
MEVTHKATSAKKIMNDEQPDDMFHYQNMKEEEKSLTAEEELIALDEEQARHAEHRINDPE